MSESVKIGGIGKNPAIDRINSLNSIDIKNYAVKKNGTTFSKKQIKLEQINFTQNLFP